MLYALFLDPCHHKDSRHAARDVCLPSTQVDILSTAVSLSTAVAPRALCAAVEYMQDDLCKMLLASYTALRSSISRMAHELPPPKGPMLQHKLQAHDQQRAEESLSRRACVAGFSMTDEERRVLLKFLKEMCQVFRGNEREWIMVDAVVNRHELRHLGDGVMHVLIDHAMSPPLLPTLRLSVSRARSLSACELVSKPVRAGSRKEHPVGICVTPLTLCAQVSSTPCNAP